MQQRFQLCCLQCLREEWPVRVCVVQLRGSSAQLAASLCVSPPLARILLWVALRFGRASTTDILCSPFHTVLDTTSLQPVPYPNPPNALACHAPFCPVPACPRPLVLATNLLLLVLLSMQYIVLHLQTRLFVPDLLSAHLRTVP